MILGYFFREKKKLLQGTSGECGPAIIMAVRYYTFFFLLSFFIRLHVHTSFFSILHVHMLLVYALQVYMWHVYMLHDLQKISYSSLY